MVEKSLDFPRTHARALALAGDPATSVVYGITAVHYEDGQPAQVLMGMIDPSLEQWDLRPAPTRVVEVVDRLVEGDRVVMLFPSESGQLKLGPEVKVDVLPEGTETLAAVSAQPGRYLADLPRF